MRELAVGPDPAQDLWRAYCSASGTDLSSLDAVERFGDSPAMADELLGLVLAGTKCATAGLVRDYAEVGAQPPRVGGHWIVVDGQGTPRCVLKTVELRVGLLSSVNEASAWDEGEGERTRDNWLVGHRRFFERQGQKRGVAFDEAREHVVFERFELVWPRC